MLLLFGLLDWSVELVSSDGILSSCKTEPCAETNAWVGSTVISQGTLEDSVLLADDSARSTGENPILPRRF